MKRRAFVTIAGLIIAFVVSGAAASAQTFSADIGFPFVAGDKAMAAGKYSVEVTAGSQVTVTGPDRSRVLLPVITMLGRHDKDADNEFVFDKLDGKLVLSEIWMAGKDGLLLVATKGAHEHAVVGGSNPKK